MAKPPVTVEQIEWGEPEPDRLQTAQPRRCPHPRDRRIRVRDLTMVDERGQPYSGEERLECGRCGAVLDEVRIRRGRRSRKRGQALELASMRELGLTPTGRFGGAEDGGAAPEPAVAQSKSGPGWWSRRYEAELEKLAVPALGRPRILVITETGTRGPHRARRMVVLYADEFVALLGGRLGSLE